MITRVFAQAITNPILPPSIGSGDSTAGGSILARFIESIASFIFLLAFFLLFIYLVTAGIAWITSEGDKAGLEKARNKLTHAIIGMIIVASGWAIFTLAGSFIGISPGNIPLPKLAP